MNNTVLAILSSIFIVGGSWLLSRFTNCGTTTTTNAAQFSVLDGELKTNPTDAFTFSLSGSTPTIPAKTKVEMKKVADHLANNPDRALSLIGNYFSSENPRGEVNLGLARAEAIKAQLVEWGAPEENILTSSQRLNNLPSDSKVIYNPVLFSFLEKKTEEVNGVNEVSEVIKEPSVLDPFVVNFPSSVSAPEMNTELQAYLDRALAYLGENPGTVLMVTGYTDDQDSARKNLSLSQRRASKVRRLLRNNGVKSEQVVAQGLGEENPIGDNDTAEGRAKNRRVEITIQ